MAPACSIAKIVASSHSIESAKTLKDGWLIYYDAYQEKKYSAVFTKDFTTFTNVDSLISVPEGHKHGTIVKTRKNKTYSYTPRHYKGEGNPYKIGHKFDEFRTTVGNNKGIKDKFKSAYEEFNSAENRGSNKILLIIIAVLIFIFFGIKFYKFNDN